jgi:cytochrome c peroxidase
MHNGTLATLEDVLRFYDNGRSENPNVSSGRGQNGDRTPRLSGSFRRVDNMSERERQDITAFLMSLSDTNFDRTIPASVPSGLPPGGFIQSHENR